MSKTELQRITNLSIERTNQVLSLLSMNLIYNVYNPQSEEELQQQQQQRQLEQPQQQLQFINTKQLEQLPISNIKLSTGCRILDQSLEGGIPLVGITEITGESASGKTQLCLQLSIQTQLSFEDGGLGGGCLYIITESKFPSSRLNQMIQTRKSKLNQSPQINNDNSRDNNFFDNIFIESIPSIERLLDLLTNRITELLEKKTIRLIIIDSIASLFRYDYGNERSEILEKSKLLWCLSNQLRLISEQYGIIVIVVNQVTDYISNNNNNNSNNNNKDDEEEEINNQQGMNQSIVQVKGTTELIRPIKRRRRQFYVPSFQDSKQQYSPFLSTQNPTLLSSESVNNNYGFGNSNNKSTVIPALGLSWANYINTRIMLTRPSQNVNSNQFVNNNSTSNNIIRKMKVILSSSLPSQSIYFFIDNFGIQGINQNNVTQKQQQKQQEILNNQIKVD
eukprot:gene7515-9236_t